MVGARDVASGGILLKKTNEGKIRVSYKFRDEREDRYFGGMSAIVSRRKIQQRSCHPGRTVRPERRRLAGRSL